MRQRTFVGVAAALWLALASGAAAAQGANKYNNPYIDDGSFTNPPIEFDFNVTEVRSRFDEQNKRWLEHAVTEGYDRVVDNLKGRYRDQSPVAPGYRVKGFAFLTQQQRWAFTIGQDGTNKSFLLIVAPSERGAGALLQLLAYTNTTHNAFYKRAWFGFSPNGLKVHSVDVQAF
jgi:hypothetical protein